jgi:hypothetical protein
MNMQDKDIDALFRNQLEGLEMMPSANVWNNINAHLDAGKKRKMVPLWSIAASITLFIAAGLFFIPKDKADSNKPQKMQTAKVDNTSRANKKELPAEQPVVETEVPEQVAAKPRKHYLAGNEKVKTQNAIVNQAPTSKPQPEPQIANQPLEQHITEPPVVIAANTTVEAKTTPVVPEDIKLTPVTAELDTATKPVMASTDSRNTSKPKRHGAFTLGGLINNVVGSIDKRQDKLIEFTDTDGDQSNITGINLGIFKVKRTSK